MKDITEKIMKLLEMKIISFEKEQKSHLQHFLINKLTCRSLLKLSKEVKKEKESVILSKKEAQEILDTVLYVRRFLIDL